MTLDEYQRAAAETRSPFTHAGKGVIPGLAYTTMGLASEVGEVANHAKKVYRDDGGTLTKGRRAAMIDEFGDVAAAEARSRALVRLAVRRRSWRDAGRSGPYQHREATRPVRA